MAVNKAGEKIHAALLATAVIRLKIDKQISPPLRALCDTGAQLNLVNEIAVQRMQWPTHQCRVQIHGIGSKNERPHTRKLVCELLSRFDDTPLAKIEIITTSDITNVWLPRSPVRDDFIPAALKEKLADPAIKTPAPIDVLLGAGVWAKIIQDGCHTNELGMAFQPTRLGWLIFGGSAQECEELTVAVTTVSEADAHLDGLLRRFWEIEEVSLVRTRTLEQERCEEIFMRTHCRLPDGRFQVDIPLRDNIEELGSSRAIALHRFRQLERRFQRDPELREKYFDSMKELLRANQMQLADRPAGEVCYYIPHHPVLKKFRIVNDASCLTDRGKSLNDMQLIGERLQEDLSSLIMRFRCHPVAVTADIKKMYLQVPINPAQWDLQRVFWRPSADSEILEYWLTVVTFGMASAPHCAVRAMIQGAREGRSQFPMGAMSVEHDFYMDDCLTGEKNDIAARILCGEMDTLLRSCGFILDKWHSNRENVIPCRVNSNTEEFLELSEFNDTTILGLRWFPKSDELTFKFQPPVPLQRHEATKRKVLSCIAKVFDPNGYIGPVVVVAKILMQRIWKANIGWDTLVPDEIFRAWQQFQHQLPLVTEIRLPRWLGISDRRHVSLHGFADASLMAYGAVLYARVDSTDHTQCILIAAKSRVAPLKPVTMPRLELCAAQLLSELVRTCKVASKMESVKTTLWSDSQIVLAWLKKEAATLKIFVNNRVQRIGRLTSDADWRYVPSADNPADLLSRGMTAAALQSASLWWHGPEWLVRSAVYWPDTQPILSEEITQAIANERKSNYLNNEKIRRTYKALAVMSVSIQNIDLIERASNAHTLFRKTAWIFRFITNLRHRGDRADHRQHGILSNDEVKAAQEYWIREEQQIYYAKEIEALKNPKKDGVETASSIHRFHPWLDKNEVLRMHGRLENALIPEHQKYPVLLPDVSLLAKLLIREAHERTLHGGLHDMIAYLRQKFWIINLRRAIRLSNFQCIRCTREKQQNMQQMMGSLPSDRVQPCRAFRHSGVDYAGPFLLKARGGRCNIMEKKWVAVFVCMVTKAVHLELVDGLSAEDFVQAFLNFTGIRGACTRLWSDNGKNFVKGEKELQKMLRSWKTMDMGQMLQKYGTEWRFITPSAPHQGGLWEAAVKSMKYHLRRIIGPHKLTSGDFRSILIQTSAVMNSRPLSAQSDDPEDFSFLTPAHFLIGEPIVQPFGANVQDVPDNQLKMAAQRQKMTQIFWKEWTKDYLHELQQRPKWRKVQPNLKPGDLVIVKEDNTPPTLWKTARVLEVYPGNDGLIRNASLRVGSSIWNADKKNNKLTEPLRRPIQKLCRLPLEVEAKSSRGQDVEVDEADRELI